MPAFKGIFAADPASVTAKLGTESVTVVFDRSKQTLRRDKNLRQAGAAGDIDGMVRELMEVLVSWDVLDEAGESVPLTDDVLLDLPSAALTNLVELIGEAGQPTSAEGNASRSTSSGPTPSFSSEPENHQNGPTPSPSPQPSASLPQP